MPAPVDQAAEPAPSEVMARFGDPAPASRRRWTIFVVGSLGFALSMFCRVSTAIISPDLAHELSLSSAQLGQLSAAFFYAFAANQIPLGLALDRFGARRVMGALGVLAGIGAVLFAAGHSFESLLLARVLMGIGLSGNLMVVLALLVAWFPVDRFAFMGGLVISIGTLGNMLAASPLALLAQTLGWRGTFFAFAIINSILAVAFVLVVRDRPPGAEVPEPKSAAKLFKGAGKLMGMYPFWAIAFSNFFRYGYVAALQGLWAGPFLIYGLGFSPITAGNILLALGVGYMFGLPLCGRISDRLLRSRKKVVLPTFIGFFLIVASIRFWNESASFVLAWFTFFGMGFMAAPGQIMYAHIKELLPADMTAQALTMTNVFPALGAAAITHALGFLIGADPTSLTRPADFYPLWYVGGIGLAVTIILYSMVPDSQALRRTSKDTKAPDSSPA
jgi:predicted MFS family arabinose efflux permease